MRCIECKPSGGKKVFLPTVALIVNEASTEASIT
jgi:hypothetical protein